MSEYLFLYRNEASTEPRSPEEMQQVMQKWGRWIQSLAANGHLKAIGQPLEGGGKVVGPNRLITDGSYAETKDLVSGYTIVQADSLEQAAELTDGCPIFDVGGLVEIRPVIEINM